MAKYKVIIAHDGLAEGTIKELPAGPVAAYMVKHGFWAEVKDEKPEPKAEAKPRKKTTAKK